MSERLDLPAKYRREVERILGMVVPDVAVWAYGSRVIGTAYQASDLDLVLRAPGFAPVPAARMGALIAAFRESNVPIIVDVHDWALVSESFQRPILADCMIFSYAGATAETVDNDGRG